MAAGERLSGLLKPDPNRAGRRCTPASTLSVPDIDWHAPWLADWRGVGEPIARRVAAGQAQPQALNDALGEGPCASLHASEPPHAALQGTVPVRFVPQADLPEGQAYEDFIFSQGQVPTREGLHDFFNALCWMHFPLAKKRLNQLQASEIARAGVGQVRGPVRDAATVFDENALLIQPSDALWTALTEHRWTDALVGLRAEWAHTRLWAFGHAALEKAVQPYKSITVHLWRVPQNVTADDIDAWLAQDLTPEKLASKPFSPLPLLGVPGWWPANQDAAFYQDASVFRPCRQRTAAEKPYANPEISPLA